MTSVPADPALGKLEACALVDHPSRVPAASAALAPVQGITGAGAAVRQLQRFGELMGVPLIAVDAATGTMIARAGDALPLLPRWVRPRLPGVVDADVFPTRSGLTFFALRLPDVDFRRIVAVGFIPVRRRADQPSLVIAARKQGWSQRQFQEWLARQPRGGRELVQSLVSATRHCVDLENDRAELTERLDHCQAAVTRTDEEIELLQSLARNLQISRSPAEVAALSLRQIHAIVQAGGTAIWIEDEPGEPRFLVTGNIPFDETGMARLIARFDDHRQLRPRVKSGIRGSLLGTEFPGLENLLIVPIAAGSCRWGWILACNLPAGRDFGPLETGLLASVATILGTHLQNLSLFREQDALVLGFVRTLVSTIDAKDAYTRGHSERVAWIARRLGQELGLAEEELRVLYQAGLLHDIGKIGVDDRVLQKDGPLTEEEFAHVQQHPVIGYTILEDLKILRPVLPGVRNHHEAFDGTGYPDGLSGEDIPLMARILAVADAFDAMTSDRPYRKGVPRDRVDEILRRGAGQQWDARVIEAYVAVREDLARIGGSQAQAEDSATATVKPV